MHKLGEVWLDLFQITHFFVLSTNQQTKIDRKNNFLMSWSLEFKIKFLYVCHDLLGSQVTEHKCQDVSNFGKDLGLYDELWKWSKMDGAQKSKQCNGKTYLGSSFVKFYFIFSIPFLVSPSTWTGTVYESTLRCPDILKRG